MGGSRRWWRQRGEGGEQPCPPAQALDPCRIGRQVVEVGVDHRLLGGHVRVNAAFHPAPDLFEDAFGRVELG